MHGKTTMAAAALMLAMWAAPAEAQIVRGVVVEGGSSTPVEGAMVVLLDSDERVAHRVLTGADGAFIAQADHPGPHHMRVDRIGYESLTTDPFDVPVTGTFQRVDVPIRPIELAGLAVEGSRRCEVRGEQGQATARAWEEARKALQAAAWTLSSGQYRYTLLKVERDLDASGERVLSEDRGFTRGTGQAPYVSLDAESLVEDGFIQPNGDGSLTYYAPDAEAFLSDAFLETHCMRLSRVERGMIGLEFEPIAGRKRSDIRGTLWIEASSAKLSRLEFSYVNRPPDRDAGTAGGQVTFGSLPSGTWVVRDWNLRMPLLATNTSRTQLYVTGYREQGGALWRVVDRSGATVLESAAATVKGTVVDSIYDTPVEGVAVRIAGTADGSADAITDVDGVFVITGLPPGQQTLELVHASLDSLGLGPAVYDVDAPIGEVTEAPLHLPGVQEILRGACAVGVPSEEPTTIVLGRVRRNGAPAAGAPVRVEWLSPGRQRLGVQKWAAPPKPNQDPPTWNLDPGDTNRLLARMDDRGVFLVCGLPQRTQLRVLAGEAGQSQTTRTYDIQPGVPVLVVTISLDREGGS